MLFLNCQYPNDPVFIYNLVGDNVIARRGNLAITWLIRISHHTYWHRINGQPLDCLAYAWQ